MALVAACWKVALQVVSEQGGYLPKIDTTWVNCWNKLVQEAMKYCILPKLQITVRV